MQSSASSLHTGVSCGLVEPVYMLV